MNQKLNLKKAFIQIPLLIIIVIFLVIVLLIGVGVVLHKKEKLTLFVANISNSQLNQEKNLKCPPCECPIFSESSPSGPKEIPIEKIVEKPMIKEITKEVPAEKIVYKEICSCPQTQSTPIQEESYTYSDYYPIILSLSDNRGNIIKISNFNGYKGPYSYKTTKTTLKIGDEIYLKVEAKDPQNRQILYNWISNSSHFNQLIGLESGHFKWNTSNEIRYTITSETIKTAGELLRIMARIKSEKEYLRFSDEFDDEIYIDYTLLP